MLFEPTFFWKFNTFENAEKLLTKGLKNLVSEQVSDMYIEEAKMHAKYLAHEDDLINILGKGQL